MKKMRKYTKDIHAKRLEKMLRKKNPCERTCPASKSYQYRGMQKLFEGSCRICFEFVNLDANTFLCPCSELGKEVAIKRSWLALEEEGYLK